MAANSRFTRLYVRYIIKTPVVFYAFLAAGIALFLYLSLGLRLNTMRSVSVWVAENQVIYDGDCASRSDFLYLYNNRKEKIYKLRIVETVNACGQTVLTVENPEKLSGEMQADIVTGSQTLLERIFIKAGKG